LPLPVSENREHIHTRTITMQASWSRKPGEQLDIPPPEERQMQPDMLNACYPYQQSSPWVKEHFPNEYIPLVVVEECETPDRNLSIRSDMKT
jgi:hypothetical protein